MRPLFKTNSDDINFLVNSENLNGEKFLLFRNSYDNIVAVSINPNKEPEVNVTCWLEIDDFLKEKVWKVWELSGVQDVYLEKRINSWEVWE